MDLAIGNLLRNAIMHNISSGTLDIAARQEHCAIIVTITNSTDETLPDDLMNLKQPFHRGEHSRISAEPGVGLGLSIADAACEAMGATLELTGRTSNRSAPPSPSRRHRLILRQRPVQLLHVLFKRLAGLMHRLRRLGSHIPVMP